VEEEELGGKGRSVRGYGLWNENEYKTKNTNTKIYQFNFLDEEADLEEI
jgi:hypothetical protein